MAREYHALPDRMRTEETCKKWDYGISEAFCPATKKVEVCHVATFRNDAGVPVAQKCRFSGKNFSIRGDKHKLGLYGQHLWRGGGKMVTITEGELDALSLSQQTGNKWAVVSIPNGADGAHKAVANSLEWLETFDSVVFMFDNDEAGRKAAEKCSLMLSVGKAKIATLPLKDASEMLVAGRGGEMVSAQWGAKPFRPDGVIMGEDLWEVVSEVDNSETFPYPWGGMNDKTYGIRLGELVVLTSGTGIGKSSICREIAHHLITNGKKVGYLALEESVKHTAKGLMGISLNVPLHIHGKEVPMDKLHDAFQETLGTGNCVLYDHFGSTDTDHLIGKIRFMVHSVGAKYIFLDHISIMVSGDDSGDERRRIDALMTKLASLTQELDIALIVVSHLKRPDGKAHEDGAQISLGHLRGSGSIGQLAFIVIGFERDQQSEENANVTTCRVLKNRFSGETGVNCTLEYYPDTGRLLETAAVSTIAKERAAYAR